MKNAEQAQDMLCFMSLNVGVQDAHTFNIEIDASYSS